MVGNCWNVVSCIALPGQVNFSSNILCVLLQEILKEVGEVILNLEHEDSMVKEVCEAIPSTYRLIHIHHICIGVPRVVIPLKVKSIRHAGSIVDIVVRTILCIESKH